MPRRTIRQRLNVCHTLWGYPRLLPYHRGRAVSSVISPVLQPLLLTHVLWMLAGAGTIAPLEVATEAHFDQTFDVNVKGVFFTVKKALPLFKDGGSIILNSSVSNVLGLPGFSAYAASKAAVRNLARAWTLELKDRRIRVNSMSPGPIDTPALETTTGLTAEQAKEAAAQFAMQIPMGRRGMPDEVAAAVAFLASDESSYITGIDLAVDGGMAQV